MNGPAIRYDADKCKFYHKNVNQAGDIISYDKLSDPNLDLDNSQRNPFQIRGNDVDNWWNLSMGIRDVLIQIRNMFCDDDLKQILTPSRSHAAHLRYGHIMGDPVINNVGSSELLMEHIMKISINNQRYCHGKPIPVWLLKQRNGGMLRINKKIHEHDITIIKQLFYSNTKLCIGVIDEITEFYGNQWIAGKLWTEYENYKPLTRFIENECRDKL